MNHRSPASTCNHRVAFTPVGKKYLKKNNPEDAENATHYIMGSHYHGDQ